MTGNIHFISAGAGSGKTYTLTEKLEELLRDGNVSPAGVIATTFTRLAAGELKERVRQKLIESGALTTANQMEQSLIGTVNGVCGDLLGRFTFEAGLPPDQTVLEEKQGDVLFYQAMEQVLADDVALVRQMNEVCERLQITLPRSKKLAWRREVKDIVDAARANNQGSAQIRELGASSAETLLAHFPKPSTQDLNKALLEAVSNAISGIDLDDDKTKGTADYVQLLRGIQAALVKNRMQWSEWIKLSKKSPTKKSKSWAEPIQQIASSYGSHPLLREDIEGFAAQLFQIAASSLDAYQELKTRKGLIDFVDQEQQLYTLLDNPKVSEVLREELQLLMVDEFQDTSPIQLALFLKLSRLTEQVIWVGDIKQSVYGFRGADPALMSAVVDCVTADGNPPQVLEKSWRSRPELVDYVNALFVPAFSDSLRPEQVRLIPAHASVASEPAVERWQLKGNNKGDRAGALVAGLNDLLDAGRTVVDKETQVARPLTYGDIAILCRTNVNLNETADALAKQNLPIRYKRPGLLSTPEGCLAMACLRRLIDPLDTLATAEILTLSRSESPESWVSRRLAFLADEDNRSHLWLADDADVPIAQLAAQRQRLPFLTPVETLRVALDAGDVRKAAYRWGPTPQRAQHRLNNLAMLVTHAGDYINQCASYSEPASAAGLVLWLQALAEAEEDTQATGDDEDAIQLVTHHGAKGLEWPVVIATDMDATVKPRLWGLKVQPSEADIDLADPLRGRTLRYWPSFKGAQSANIPLVDKIENSSEGRAALEAETEEAKRLLYVSFTRPRDSLIVTMNKNATSGEWMDTLGAAWMLPTDDELTLPDGSKIPTNHWDLGIQEEEVAAVDFQPQWLVTKNAAADQLPRSVSPSSAAPIDGAAAGKVIELGERLAVSGAYKPDEMGSALHAVIASYINGNRELATIERIIADYGMQGSITAQVATESANRLIRAIEENFKPISYATEYPVQYENEQGQLLTGWIDLLVETEAGYVIIDHKASPQARSEWGEIVVGYSGQLDAYAKAVKQATGVSVASSWIHFGITGGLVSCQ